MQSRGCLKKIFIVSGPSGSGKTTLLKGLCRRGFFRKNFVKVVTAVTRLPRQGERHGEDYWFISKEEFLSGIKKKAFAEYKEIYGEYYGVPKAALEAALKKGKNVLLCIDVRGAMSIKRLFPGRCVLIFVAAPDQESLSKRLHSRLTESASAVSRRLASARREVSYARRYHYLIINDKKERAAKELYSIITAQALKVCAPTMAGTTA